MLRSTLAAPQIYNDAQNRIHNPVQFEFQSQTPSPVQFQATNVHHEQPTHQRDMKSLAEKGDIQTYVLQYQVEAEELQNQSQLKGQQPYLQSQAELQPEQLEQKNARRRNMPQSSHQNQPKRQRLALEMSRNTGVLAIPSSVSNRDSAQAKNFTSSETPEKCPLCDNMFANPHAVRHHFRTVHARARGSRSNICEECLMPCSSETKFREHWKSAHVAELEFVCSLCGARFSRHRNLSLHLIRMQNVLGKPLKRTRPTRKLPKSSISAQLHRGS